MENGTDLARQVLRMPGDVWNIISRKDDTQREGTYHSAVRLIKAPGLLYLGASTYCVTRYYVTYDELPTCRPSIALEQ